MHLPLKYYRISARHYEVMAVVSPDFRVFGKQSDNEPMHVQPISPPKFQLRTRQEASRANTLLARIFSAISTFFTGIS